MKLIFYFRFLFSTILVLSLLSPVIATENAAVPADSKGSPPRIFKQSLPGYQFRFPEDHFSHEGFRTEWWYYTGHLRSDKNREFGFELTFFRTGWPVQGGIKSGAWALTNIYMAHFALSDINGKRYFNEEKLCRPGVAMAGASDKECKVWTENWTLERKGDAHVIRAAEGDNALELSLKEFREPIIHGENGVSQKASCVGCASHYYSFTRMPATGTLTFAGEKFNVTGEGWMDHEFGSNQLTDQQIGWDWFSVQLDDKTEIMLYAMRLKNGKLDPNSSGTVVSFDGKSEHLQLSDYKIDALSTWKSPHTGGTYPSKWHVVLPGRKMDFMIEPRLSDQELVSKRKDGVSYWEGACSVSGTKNGKPIKGKAYVELTGYSKEFHLNI